MEKRIVLSLVVLLAVSGFAPAATTPAQADYAENQIIVKFRRPVADTLEMRLSDGISARELKLSRSMDMLNKKYRLKKAKPLFKNFRENKQHLKALLKKDKTLLTKKEKHILGRLKRAPKGAKVPELDRIYKIELDPEPGQSLEDVVTSYNNDPNVEYAELNYIVSICRTPNDPCYPIQWPLNNTGQMYPESGRYNAPPGAADCDIDAPQAWDIHTGSSEIIVAVVDTGVDYTHRDIDDNMWVNPDEIPGNSLDDDGNGYVDDIYGYDFCNYDSDPKDDHGHGTHCGGIISAEGDNDLDIAGVCWDAKIMALKFLDSWGSGWNSDAVEAFYYAVENGADVTSNSWGSDFSSETMEDAINYAYSQGVIMVAAAGNDNSNQEIYYPVCYDNMIGVAATNSNDEKASFSNYGDWVDIAAPGVDILSLRATGTSMRTVYDDYTTISSGTSMACPHVAGACALLLSIYPEIQVDELEQFLTEAADPIAAGICASGRLNVHRAAINLLGPQGRICLDDYFYSCSSLVGIVLFDSDLKGSDSQIVTVTTDGSDYETLLLTESDTTVGIFAGVISVEPGPANTEDGILQVSHSEIITVTYNDVNDGTGSPATVEEVATIDCQSPIVSNVQVTDISCTRAMITFETNEPATASIYCGLTCDGSYTITDNNSTLTTNHTLYLAGLLSQTEYYFVIDAIDVAGNLTTDSNEGQCYPFTTKSPLNVPDEFLTIQAAINAAIDGDIVIVEPNTYTGPGNRDIEVTGKSVTVRSANGPENCIIDCNGSEDEHHIGFYFHDISSSSILSGFTVTNGYDRFGDGGGIVCNRANITISNCNIRGNTIWGGRRRGGSGGGILVMDGIYLIYNCTISNNSAGRFGSGGISCSNSALLTVSNCTINGNSGYYGGGIGCHGYNSSLSINNCTFSDNSAFIGGGICCWGYDSSLSINNCTSSDNSASYGGGIYCGYYDNSLSINNCTITGNEASKGGAILSKGGAILIDESIYMINKCMISNNSADEGGGVYCYSESCDHGYNSMISNCTLAGNSANNFGGGIYCNGISPAIRNCRITGNRSFDRGGGIQCFGSSPTITNCTLADNLATKGSALTCKSGGWVWMSNVELSNCILWDGGDEISKDDESTITISYSNVQGGWEGQGNIDIDPCFAEPGLWNANATPEDANDDFWIDGDYHLTLGSPCINAGDPCYVPAPNETDLDGNPRIINSRIDMGAYEANYIQSQLRILPQVINRNNQMKRVMAWIQLPEGITKDQIDQDTPLLLYPGPLEPINQYIFEHGKKGDKRVSIFAFFDKSELTEAVPDNGQVQLEVVGNLTTGQEFYGYGFVTILDRQRPRKWRLLKNR